MVELEKMNNIGYVVKRKDKNLYVVNDAIQMSSDDVWGNDVADVIVYPSIEKASQIKRNFDKHKNEFYRIKDVEVEVQLIHKKEVMIARLKG